MAKVAPWHSIRRYGPNVFHDNSDCPKGKDIGFEYRKAGHRCRVRCPTCNKLEVALRRVERTAKLVLR
jgi:hypothetical protein